MLHFIVLHRCWVFCELKATPSSNKKIMAHFIAILAILWRSRTSHISDMYQYPEISMLSARYFYIWLPSYDSQFWGFSPMLSPMTSYLTLSFLFFQFLLFSPFPTPQGLESVFVWELELKSISLIYALGVLFHNPEILNKNPKVCKNTLSTEPLDQIKSARKKRREIRCMYGEAFPPASRPNTDAWIDNCIIKIRGSTKWVSVYSASSSNGERGVFPVLFCLALTLFVIGFHTTQKVDTSTQIHKSEIRDKHINITGTYFYNG